MGRVAVDLLLLCHLGHDRMVSVVFLQHHRVSGLQHMPQLPHLIIAEFT